MRPVHVEGSPLEINLDVLAADDSALSHSARDDRGVTGHPAARGENCASGDDAMKVFRGGFVSNEDHVLAGLRALLRGIRIKNSAPARGAGARREAGAKRCRANRRVDDRMQQLIELTGGHSPHRFDLVNQSLAHHVSCDSHSRGGGALSRARLQQIEFAALDGELEILHVSIVPLQAFLGIHQLRKGIGQLLCHLVDVERSAHARDDILALRVGEKLTVEALFACGRIACERHACPGVVSQIPEHHRNDAHRGAEVFRDAVNFPIIFCLLERPRLPDGLDGSPELDTRIAREIRARPVAHQRLVLLDEVLQFIFTELGVRLYAGRHPLRFEQVLEIMRRDFEHDVRVHLDEPPE